MVIGGPTARSRVSRRAAGFLRCTRDEGSHRSFASSGSRRNEQRVELRPSLQNGVHYCNSTEVGTALGTKIGALAAANALPPSE
jgi:hypothetical protein